MNWYSVRQKNWDINFRFLIELLCILYTRSMHVHMYDLSYRYLIMIMDLITSLVYNERIRKPQNGGVIAQRW